MRLPRRVDHGEFDALDEGKKGCPSGPILSRLRGVGRQWCWGRHAQGGAHGLLLYRRQTNNIRATVSDTCRVGIYVSLRGLQPAVPAVSMLEEALISHVVFLGVPLPKMHAIARIGLINYFERIFTANDQRWKLKKARKSHNFSRKPSAQTRYLQFTRS